MIKGVFWWSSVAPRCDQFHRKPPKKFQRSCCCSEISRLTEKTERSAFSDQDQGDQIWRKFLPLRNFATLWLCISKFWALLNWKWANWLLLYLLGYRGRGCSPAVEHMPCNLEVVGLNPAGCWAFFFFFLSFPTFLHQRSVLSQVSLGSVSLPVWCESN